MKIEADGNRMLKEKAFLENLNMDNEKCAKEHFKEMDADGSGDMMLLEYLKGFSNWARYSRGDE
jgi:hypothetical protein